MRPHRWVALQLDRQACGLFWAGGGLQRCRDLLVAQSSAAETASALVPATPEALLRLVLDLNLPDGEAEQAPKLSRTSRTSGSTSVAVRRGSLSDVLSNRLESRHRHRLIWRVVTFTSVAWMTVLAGTVWSFSAVLERQDRKLELLLERTAPARTYAPVMPAP